MIVKAFEDVILLQDKRDVVKVHLFSKMVQYGIRPMERDFDIIIELYFFGGYNGSEEQARFISSCIEKGYGKSEQSVRNAISKYIGIGIVEKPKNLVSYVNPKFIPIVECDRLVLSHTVSHAK